MIGYLQISKTLDPIPKIGVTYVFRYDQLILTGPILPSTNEFNDFYKVEFEPLKGSKCLYFAVGYGCWTRKYTVLELV